ncbi:hypothetical protein [Sphingobium aromaticiconvertens]|uniref:hypothetical protein n=1 Tax=Sphingobium aromaticiconvertens TaxID=365341 RepID=UPI00301932A9
MRDEYDDRLLDSLREESNAGIDRLLDRIMQAFRVLHRSQWSAPWATQQAERRCCEG